MKISDAILGLVIGESLYTMSPDEYDALMGEHAAGPCVYLSPGETPTDGGERKWPALSRRQAREVALAVRIVRRRGEP